MQTFLEARITFNETVRRLANGPRSSPPGWGDMLTADVMSAYKGLATAASFVAGFAACTAPPRLFVPESDGVVMVGPGMVLGAIAAALTSEYLKDRHEHYIRHMGLTNYARMVGPQNVAGMPWYLGHLRHTIEKGECGGARELDTVR